MGIISQGKELWKALFTRTQRRVLGLLFGHPERSFYANEIVRLAGVGNGAVQRELAKLCDASLLSMHRVGNQKHYRANRECAFYPEIRAMVLKTYGTLDVLRTAVSDLEGHVELAFLYGPGIDGPASPGSDLHLMLVSEDVRRPAMQPGIDAAGKQIGRSVKTVLLRSRRFADLLGSHDPRLMTVLAQPCIVLIGNLEPDAGQQPASRY